MKTYNQLTLDIANLALSKMAQDADRWITVKPNGPDAKGRPALIGGDGTIKAGMGGKFNGQKIGEIKRAGGGSSAPKKPERPEFLRADHQYWNGKVYGDEKKGYRVYLDQREHKLNAEELQQFKQYREDYKNYKKNEAARERQGATYLNVPYSEKERAKAHGAKWDPDERKWFIPGGEEVPERLQHFLPSGAKKESGGSRQAPLKPLSEMSREESVGYMQELKKKQRQWRNTINEGGEGYNPYDSKFKEAYRYFKKKGY